MAYQQMKQYQQLWSPRLSYSMATTWHALPCVQKKLASYSYSANITCELLARDAQSEEVTVVSEDVTE